MNQNTYFEKERSNMYVYIFCIIASLIR